MDYYVAIVHHHPTIAGLALLPALLAVLRANSVQCAISQRIQHAVAGAIAKHKIIGEGRYVFYVQQQNVFTFFVFKRINDGMSKFKCVQKSPHNEKCNCAQHSRPGFARGRGNTGVDCIHFLAFAERRRK